MTQRAETRVLRLGGTCPGMPQPFGTIFWQIPRLFGHCGFSQFVTSINDSANRLAAETIILGHFPNIYESAYHASLV